MGISHEGYLADKGLAPSSDMTCESIQLASVKENPATHMNPRLDLVILGQNFGQNFQDDLRFLVGGLTLAINKRSSNRIEATLPADSLASGNKYDVVLQQDGEASQLNAGALEVTV